MGIDHVMPLEERTARAFAQNTPIAKGAQANVLEKMTRRLEHPGPETQGDLETHGLGMFFDACAQHALGHGTWHDRVLAALELDLLLLGPVAKGMVPFFAFLLERRVAGQGRIDFSGCFLLSHGSGVMRAQRLEEKNE